MASLILVRNVVGELQPKRTLAASRGFLAAARLSCIVYCQMNLVLPLTVDFCQIDKTAHKYGLSVIQSSDVVHSSTL